VQQSSRIAVDYKPSKTTTAPQHARWFLTGLMVPLIGGLIAYKLAQDRAPEALPLAGPDVVTTPELSPELSLPAPIVESTPEPPIGETTEFVVRPNDTLDKIFRHLELSIADLAAIRTLPDVRKSLDMLRPGDRITFVHRDGSLQSFSRRISETEVLTISRGEDGFVVDIAATPLEIRTTHAHGVIDSSLFVAARAAGVSPEIILRLANDIFGWKIDFALDIQPGDRFTVIYEQKYRDGEYIGDGRILAADFVNAGRSYRAVYYTSADGKIADYFAPDGRSMRRQFLRAPLEFTRISSNFNPRRRHPILNTIRAHRGVDYAAPTGTVIKAAGDGRVAFAGTQGGYGRVIILEHGGGITTLYGHMSRFAKGMRAGVRVTQGTTIGYVGSTGAATGPHLHYEYRVNGVHQNPRTVPLPDAQPIPPSYLAEFQSQSGVLLAQLDRARDSAMAALPSE
jgi:murein DD-endopeptidase MepM/ murein hydrolase activator NlpD